MNNFDVELPQDGVKLTGERVSNRALFLRKLYFLLALQFAFTNLAQWLIGRNEEAHNWITNAHWGIAISIGVQIVLLIIAAYFFRHFFRRFPFNVFGYVYFVALECYLACYFTDGVLGALLSSALLMMSLGLCTYALTNVSDFTFLGGTFYIIVSALINYTGWMVLSDVSFLTLVVVTAFTVTLGFYLIYDTRYLVIGQSMNSESEDPFVGSIVVYLDFFFIGFRVIENLGRVFKNIRY